MVQCDIEKPIDKSGDNCKWTEPTNNFMVGIGSVKAEKGVRAGEEWADEDWDFCG